MNLSRIVIRRSKPQFDRPAREGGSVQFSPSFSFLDSFRPNCPASMRLSSLASKECRMNKRIGPVDLEENGGGEGLLGRKWMSCRRGDRPRDQPLLDRIAEVRLERASLEGGDLMASRGELLFPQLFALSAARLW